jgi:DNA-binding NtrC family response regulator
MADQAHQNVLIADDEAATTRLVLQVLAAKGIRGTVVRDAPAACDRLERLPWDLVLADLEVPQGGGFEIVRRAKLRSPELPVVMLSPDGSARTAVRAMREGCDDFLVKPLDRPAVEALLESFLPTHAVPLAAADESDSRCLYQIAGRSAALLETVALARKIAPTSAPALVSGESGTGKELISYLIHRASRRARGPFIRVNCAALSETLLESELFGHERGAFTGAVAQRKGRFEMAHGGTLLLDEVTETGPRLQAELLRVIEHQDFERVGGSEPVSVSVRLISTTNRDLAREVEKGKFRTDLYYRLGAVRLTIPPLRDRKEDILVLVWHFVNQFAREVRRSISHLDPEMMERFFHYDWPGNVRQLRNVVRTALILGSGPVLSLSEAPWLRAELEGAQRPVVAEPASLRLESVERHAILEALRLTKSHQAKAAHLLGITDRTLRAKLRRYRQEGHLREMEDVPCLGQPALA